MDDEVMQHSFEWMQFCMKPLQELSRWRFLLILRNFRVLGIEMIRQNGKINSGELYFFSIFCSDD